MKNNSDTLSGRVKTWIRTAAEKAGIITRAAATKAEELSKIGKLKMDIYQLQREQGRLYADLGRIAYKTLEGRKAETLASQPEVEDLCRRITGLADDIRKKELKIEQATREKPPVQAEVPAEEKTAAPKKTPAGKKTAAAKKTPAAKKAPAARTGRTAEGGGKKKTTAAAGKAGSRKTAGKA